MYIYRWSRAAARYARAAGMSGAAAAVVDEQQRRLEMLSLAEQQEKRKKTAPCQWVAYTQCSGLAPPPLIIDNN